MRDRMREDGRVDGGENERKWEIKWEKMEAIIRERMWERNLETNGERL